MIYNHISDLIGNTPLLRIAPEVHKLKNIELYAKLEYYNPFGSVKDRIARGMLMPVLEELKEGNKTVVEASSGNTAKALAALCGTFGLNSKVVTNRIKVPEVRMMLQLLGTDIEELPGMSDCPDPLDPNDFTTVAANLARSEPDKYYYTDQYFNECNRQTHYEETGKELIDDLKKVDYFFGFLGTCGSSMGAGKYLKEANADARVYGVVAESGHHIPGGRNMNELWEVGFFRKDFYKELISGKTSNAISGMLELNRRCGMMCGPTTGLTYYAALEKLRQHDEEIEGGKKATAVFIACDRLEAYSSYLKKHAPDLFAGRPSRRPTVSGMTDTEIESTNSLNAGELQKIIESKSPLIIDVRSHFAYSIGHIAGSINILDELLTLMIEEGPCFPKDRAIVIVCRVGDVSKRYAAFLARQGYQSYSLTGGIGQWKVKGHQLVTSIEQ